MKLTKDIGIILLAAGKGLRLQEKTPKQYLALGRKPVFIQALKPLLESLRRRLSTTVVVVLPSLREVTERQLQRHLTDDALSVTLVDGGTKRIESLFEAIAYLRTHHPGLKAVLIHDAARPLIRDTEVTELVRLFEENHWDAAVISKPVAESLFIFDKDGALIRGINRESFCLGETPFIVSWERLSRLQKRWMGKLSTFHDSVDILELAALDKQRFRVGHYPGKHPNIKLTYPHDRIIIREYFRKRNGK